MNSFSVVARRKSRREKLIWLDIKANRQPLPLYLPPSHTHTHTDTYRQPQLLCGSVDNAHCWRRREVCNAFVSAPGPPFDGPHYYFLCHASPGGCGAVPSLACFELVNIKILQLPLELKLELCLLLLLLLFLRYSCSCWCCTVGNMASIRCEGRRNV